MQDRRAHILSLLVGATPERETQRLCEVAAEVTGATGAGIMLMSGDIARGSLGSTDAVSDTIEELQYSLGEGPCVDAHREDRPVMEPDLLVRGAARWPAFAPAVIDVGARAVYGFPLHVGSVRLGALNLYRDRSGAMAEDHHRNALVVVRVIAEAVLVLQSGAAPGQVARELEASANFQYVVHQASGMVAAQMAISVTQALLCIRAHAFANDRKLADVARDVVERRLRFYGSGAAER